MKIIYKAKNGKTITFDDFGELHEENNGPWVSICKHCYDNLKEELKETRISDCPSADEECNVYGCKNPASLYVDFAKDQVEITTLVTVALEKTIRVSEEFEATEEQVEMLKRGENPFFDELNRLCEKESEVEYDFAATDEDSGKTIIDWD